MSHSQHPPDVRDALIVALAVISGNRRGELHNLPLADMLDALKQPEAGGMYRAYTNGKTGEAIMRFAPYHVPMIDRYLALRPENTSPYMFLNLNPAHVRYGLQLSLVGINRARQKLCDAAGVPLITYQELRRRLATKIAIATNPTIAAHALNHSKYSGERVIRLFYYDPGKTAVDDQIAAAFDF